MADGRIIDDGTPQQVFANVQKLRDAGLSVPETTQLLFELRKEGIDLPLSALSVEECAEAVFKAFAN